MERPSRRELYNKLKQAKETVTSEKLLIINSEVIAEDAIDLGYQVIDLNTVLLKLFDEIDPDHYVGNYPPQKSYESQIKDSDLFAFRWKSKYFGCEVYLKFSFKRGNMYLVSLHQQRVPTGV